MASSSSSTSTTKLQRKHDVFLSFRGADTRVGFTSYLYTALQRKNLLTFMDDGLKPGEVISDSLVKAIEDSMLSVIIFSEQYASSRWCLYELVKILECRNRGQIVIPIFYKVDPSHVRNQIGSFGVAFAELLKRNPLEMEEERRLRAALKEAANISGHDSRNMVSEAKFIERIVEDILNKMSKMISHPMNLVGIAERIREIEYVLEMESQEVRIVGILGMGGIGKTTIAGAVYNKICTEFEACLFVPNIREELKRNTVVDLQRRFVSRLLDREIPDTGPLSFGNHLIKNGLRRKKVLIVFDDVDSSMLLQELLLGRHDSFGPGSRILVTSRDRHVLKQVVDATYEVDALNNNEALQLLKSKAFNKIDPTSEYEDLLDRAVNYAKGNPSALLVLGFALYDRSVEDWYSKLNQFGQGQDDDILNVLRISYDGLSKEEKNVFLDIACFFIGMDRYRVTPILENKSSVHFCISNLISKSLITTSGNILWMHDLLLEMAYGIVNEESKNRTKRRWLVDHEDIYDLLKTRKGREAVKGICKMRLKSEDFEGMLPRHGFEYLPKKLRYYQWFGYPSRSLALKFCAKNLVDFGFHRKRKWPVDPEDTYVVLKKRKVMEALKGICLDVPESSKMRLKSDVFKGMRSLKFLIIKGKTSKLKLHRHGLQYLPNKLRYFRWDRYPSRSFPQNFCAKDLVEFDFSRSKVEKLWSGRQKLVNLRRINLSHSDCLTKLPDLSEAKQLKHVALQYCGSLIEIPSYFQYFENLKEISLDCCYNLQSFPRKINSNNIKNLSLKYCSNIKKNIEIPANMERLNLSGTAIEEVQQSFGGEGTVLWLTGCSNITRFPKISGNIKDLYLGGTAIEDVPSSIQFLTNLRHLCMTDCKKLFSLSSSICELKYLTQLDIDGCSKLQSLPENMGLMESLEKLLLSETAIRELPELPLSLKYLSANNCELLEIIPSSTVGDSVSKLCFANCFKLDQKALMEDLQLKIQNFWFQDQIGMFFPGSEIPKWFNDQSGGSSITIQFPSNPSSLEGIAFCLVIVHPYEPNDITYQLELCWQAKINNGEHNDVIGSSHSFLIGSLKISESDHMYLCYNNIRHLKNSNGSCDGFSKYFGHEVRFEFNTEVGFGTERDFKVKMCGVHLFHANPNGLSNSDERW